MPLIQIPGLIFRFAYRPKSFWGGSVLAAGSANPGAGKNRHDSPTLLKPGAVTMIHTAGSITRLSRAARFFSVGPSRVLRPGGQGMPGARHSDVVFITSFSAQAKVVIYE